jgi:hypothetical protein
MKEIRTAYGISNSIDLLRKEELYRRLSNATSIRNIKANKFIEEVEKTLEKYNF